LVSTHALFPIEGVVRRYDWGSPTLIPSVLGVEPDGGPYAELWFGAHPDDPSPVPVHETHLEKLIDADPVALLGADTVARFGPRLPFLLKLLGAGKALSIQVHPTIAQAQAGFAAEDAAGLPRDAPHRNYRDPNHKPELICALTDFEALCGFRPVAETLRLLEALALPELDFVHAALTGADGLREAFTAVLTVADPLPLVEAVRVRAAMLPDEWSGVGRAVAVAAGDFPGDIGVVLTLLLNYVRLAPGEAIFLRAGNVHAYLRGLGVEIMANSDNVLRCGLTPKHVDVPELLAITDFTPLDEPRMAPARDGAGALYAPQVEDFALRRIQVSGPVEVAGGGPRIVLVADGVVEVGADGQWLSSGPGEAVFAEPAAGPLVVRGSGLVFVASAGVHSDSVHT
jgi:mannose-6-phosphate isomerase